MGTKQNLSHCDSLVTFTQCHWDEYQTTEMSTKQFAHADRLSMYDLNKLAAGFSRKVKSVSRTAEAAAVVAVETYQKQLVPRLLGVTW